LDGAGMSKQPGSGNAPVTGNTSLDITTATMVVDAALKKLGVRDQVYLEATGDIVLPAEAIMLQSLGADGVAAARLWMGMGLGCKLMQKCSSGGCYYGIASGDGRLFSEGLDPKVVGPKGLRGASWWFDTYAKLQLEAGADPSGRVPLRSLIGLNNNFGPVRVRGPYEALSLLSIFSVEEVFVSLQGRISFEELKQLLLGNPPPPPGPSAFITGGTSEDDGNAKVTEAVINESLRDEGD
jgi:hypothetical protein